MSTDTKSALEAASFLIDEITDLEGREGLTDFEFAEQVIALAHSKRDQIRAALAAAQAAGAIPAEPTLDMIVAGDEAILAELNDHTFALKDETPALKCWRAMIRALSPPASADLSKLLTQFSAEDKGKPDPTFEQDYREATTAGANWKCKARMNATPDPQDCDWPICSCDPYADKVLSGLAESGYTLVPDGAAPAGAQPSEEELTRLIYQMEDSLQLVTWGHPFDRAKAMARGLMALLQDGKK